MGQYEIVTELIKIVNMAMDSYEKGNNFLKEGEGYVSYMTKYQQMVGGSIFIRAGSDTARINELLDKFNNSEDAAKLAAARATSTYNTEDFFDFDKIFDFSINQKQIFRAPSDFKWSKTTGNIKKDVTLYIMDSLCFYAECIYLSTKNLLKYYPKLLKDKIKLIKDKASLFSSSITSLQNWKEAIIKNDVNKLFLDTTLESSMEKRESDEEYKNSRREEIRDAAEAVFRDRLNK